MQKLSLPLSEMSLVAQKNRLLNFIQSMCDEGFINGDFYQLLTMKESLGQEDYLVRTVVGYCSAAEKLFTQMTDEISQPVVNYHHVGAFARVLLARTKSIGAEHVKVACNELIVASTGSNKDYCTRALYWVKSEFSKLRSKFETLVQMERKIIDLVDDHLMEAGRSQFCAA